MPRLTAACPEALISDANNLAMCLALGPADGETYEVPCCWKDAVGNLYSAASWEASDAWIAASQGTLIRPAWDDTKPYIINMTAANRAQDALVVWVTGPNPIPQAILGKLTVVAGDDGPGSLLAMGLTPIPFLLGGQP